MTAKKDTITIFQLFYALLFPFVFPALILFLSGDWFWLEGWIWGIWFIALCIVTTIYLYIYDPALLKERFQHQRTDNQKPGQAYIIYVTLLLFLLWMIIMPLDAKKYAWTALPLLLQIIGAIGLIPSAFFFFRAFHDNTFLSPLIRVQKERKQHVVSTGVYGIVRHPMYLGAACMYLSMPLLLGSLYGLLIGIVLLLLLVPRILGEEKMLMNELEGYTEYKKKVKYRLVPYIW